MDLHVGPNKIWNHGGQQTVRASDRQEPSDWSLIFLALSGAFTYALQLASKEQLVRRILCWAAVQRFRGDSEKFCLFVRCR